VVGELVIVHDAATLTRTAHVWREDFPGCCSGCSDRVHYLFIVRWSIAGPIVGGAVDENSTDRQMGAIVAMPDLDLLRPLAREMESWQKLRTARSARGKEGNYATAGNQSGHPRASCVRGKLQQRLF